METPVFDSLEQLTANFMEHRDSDPDSFFLCGVEVTSDLLEEADVERPGWYFARADLKRFLPLKHVIHRRPLGTPAQRAPMPEWFKKKKTK